MERAAEGEIRGAAVESLFGADLGDVGRVVLLGEVREDEMARAAVEDFGIGEEVADDAIRKMPRAAHHALLDVPGIRADLEHVEIVIRFEDQEIGFAQVMLHKLRHVAEVGNDGDFGAIGAKGKADGIGGIVGDREGIDLDVADLEALGRRGCIRRARFGLYGWVFGIFGGEHLKDVAMRGLGEVCGAAPFARHLAKSDGMVGVLVGNKDCVDAFGAGAAQRVKAALHFLAADSSVDEKSRRLGFEQRGVARAS